jgi:hypothetical protein
MFLMFDIDGKGGTTVTRFWYCPEKSLSAFSQPLCYAQHQNSVCYSLDTFAARCYDMRGKKTGSVQRLEKIHE